MSKNVKTHVGGIGILYNIVDIALCSLAQLCKSQFTLLDKHRSTSIYYHTHFHIVGKRFHIG